MNNSSDHNISKLFEYLRNHEWDKFAQLLNRDDTLDVNTRDSHGNHLLTYAVRFNKLSIVEKLIEKNAKYDIVDKMGRSILYDAIVSNFYDIIVRLLDYSDKTIGVMITDIRDINGSIPLHYAIGFKNTEIVKLLLKHKSNTYLTDTSGYNALHLATRSGSFEIVKEIAKGMANLNWKTNKGESALHISINYQYNQITKFLLNEGVDPDIIDNENEFSPLHYAVGWNNIEIVGLLLKMGANPNKQDIYGNVPLMYCIKEDYGQCFDIIMKNNNVQLNYWNIDGKIILHEVLEEYDESKKHYVDKLILGSNLSIQDSFGNTCLHYLIVHNIWEGYEDVLKKKKLNIFARNSHGRAVIDLIYPEKQNEEHDEDQKEQEQQEQQEQEDDDGKMNEKKAQYNKFINIVVESYVNILRKDKKNWTSELDKICSRGLSELSESEKKYISENIKTNEDFESECKTLIHSKLIDEIERYRKGTLSYCHRSYPTILKQCVDIKEGPSLDVCTFTGSILDVLIGLIFLIKKHGNACTTLGKNHTPNEDLCNFYKSMGLIMNGRCDFLNFEIVWINYKLYMIDNFSKLFNNCIKSSARFIIVPLGIEMVTGSHANYLIYDKEIKEIERFEPHGGTTPIGFNYNSQYLDEILVDYFKSLDPEIKYINPRDYIPKIGFQIMDSQEQNRTRIGDPGGFCALWSIWYVDQRLTYYTYDRRKLIKHLFSNIKAQGVSYRNMIRNYARNIIKQRDTLLKMVGLDINDWLNDNYTNNQLDTLIGHLMTEINMCCIAKP